MLRVHLETRDITFKEENKIKHGHCCEMWKIERSKGLRRGTELLARLKKGDGGKRVVKYARVQLVELERPLRFKDECGGRIYKSCHRVGQGAYFFVRGRRVHCH